MVKGLTQLLVFWTLGESLQYGFDLPISGGVIGMLLLFGYLMLSNRLNDGLKDSSQLLISQLSLLLLPGCAGLFFLGERMQDQWLPVLSAIAAGTLISIVLCLYLMNHLVKSQED